MLEEHFLNGCIIESQYEEELEKFKKTCPQYLYNMVLENQKSKKRIGMLREKLLKLLKEYQPTQEEIRHKKDIIEFINKYPNCFERSLEIGHITASAWLLNKDGSKALLMHHNKLDMWVQLGGHCDGNPDAFEVAIKESQEESGIDNIVAESDKIFDVDIHLVPDYKNVKAHYHYDIRFLLKVDGDQDFKKNSESKELRWITKDINQLPTQEQTIIRLFNKWVNYK